MDQQNVKYCPNCGSPFVPPQKFCIQCGHPLPAFDQTEDIQTTTPKTNRYVMGQSTDSVEPKIVEAKQTEPIEERDQTEGKPYTATQSDAVSTPADETRTFTRGETADDFSDWVDDYNEDQDLDDYADDYDNPDDFTEDIEPLERSTADDMGDAWGTISGYADKLKQAAKGVADTVTSQAAGAKDKAQSGINKATSSASFDRHDDYTDDEDDYINEPAGLTQAEKWLWGGRVGMGLAWFALLLGALNRLSIFMIAVFLISHFASKFAMKRYTKLTGDYKRIYRTLWKVQWTIFVIMIALLAVMFVIQFITTSVRTSMNYALNQFHWPDVSVKELIDTIINQVKSWFGGGSGSTAIPDATSSSQQLFNNVSESASSTIGQ
ncbi:MAG: hypothetical protein Q4A55_03195 [Aerococcus sp.]|nr:hypothetical protein [Aerococcus sp.]